MESIKSGLTYTNTITMITETCINCGIVFGIPSNFREECQRMGRAKSFYCPNGHGQHFAESTEQKLKRQLDNEKRIAAQDRARVYDMYLDELNKSKKLTKQLKRIHKGVCPCCNRSFINLKRHIETKHPDILKS